MLKRLLKWLGFRKRRVPVGELCPWSGEDYKFVCRYAADGSGEATLRQLLSCALNDDSDIEVIRELLQKTEGTFRG